MPMVALTLKTTTAAQPDFLSMPWSTPLEDWPDEMAVRLPRGRHRHVVRFIDNEGTFLAFKELPPALAHKEFALLEFLKEEGLPVVELVGVADQRTAADGSDLEAVLITQHLRHSLPYLHLFAQPGSDGLHVQLVDALAILLCRIHLAGFFWGDCSLGNALFRRDAGELVAYLVDTETGEVEQTLTEGQREHDLTIASENIAGGLYELEALGKLPVGVDPIEVVESLCVRYRELWNELTRTDELNGDELYRINERLQRLNDLGFDTEQMEILQDDDGRRRVRFRPAVVEEGHHRRVLQRLTGIVAQENQARRLLRALHGYGAWLASEPGADEIPEALMAYRWFTERYQPTVAAIPDGLRSRLSEPEFYVQVMEHLWYLSETAGQDYGLVRATNHYIENVLADLPDEATVLVADEDGLSAEQPHPASEMA
jgi:hypothetical protein